MLMDLVAQDSSAGKQCVCGNTELLPFSAGYLRCAQCETLIATRHFDPSIADVTVEDEDLYGKEYWFSHQAELGHPDIEARAREDLSERCMHWLRTLLKYKTPPGNVLELGCAHGGFVALLNWAGFNATGLELSREITEYARRTFGIKVLTGALENQDLTPASFDAIVMFDVLEHLADPTRTITNCFELLKADGILVIQTPRYPGGLLYDEMVRTQHNFLVQLKDKEHLFLLSDTSLERFLIRSGAYSVTQEKAIFGHYDQFVIASKQPLVSNPVPMALAATPGQRLVQALLDGRENFERMQDRWQESEDDRVSRLGVIKRISNELAAAKAEVNHLIQQHQSETQRLNQDLVFLEADRAKRLDAINDLFAKWLASETDRAERLDVIHDFSAKWMASEAACTQQLAVIEDLSTKLKNNETERARHLVSIKEHASTSTALNVENQGLKRAISAFRWSRTGQLLSAIGVQVPAPSEVKPPILRGLSWLPRGTEPKKYSLLEFQREYTEARADLNDVRGYNTQMLDIFATLRPLAGAVLLDIGASPHGFALEHALQLGVAEYCGVGLGIGTSLMVEAEPSVGLLLKMNADELAFPANSFDLIITLSTFEHFFHPDRVLREMHRVLKPGGAMLVNFQPVWTSIQGHHLHHKPDISRLLPSWSHLRWGKEEMQRQLRSSWPQSAAMTLDEVAQWIYDSDEINRLPVQSLRKAFQDSPFTIEWMTPLIDEWTAEQSVHAQDVSRALSLPTDDLAIKGFSLLMTKK